MAKADRNIPALTGARFIAAMAVVAYHQAGDSATLDGLIANGPRWLSNGLLTGYVGVSFFYVLSGFILMHNYPGLHMSVRRFFANRIVRIYPMYLLGLLLAIPFLLKAISAEPMISGTSPRELWVAGLLVSDVLMLQSWIPQFALLWNPPAWSLSNELFFYALFPLAAAFIFSKSNGFIAIVMGVCLFVGVLPSLYASLAPIPGFGDLTAVQGKSASGMLPNFFKFNPIIRFPEFVVGVCLAQLYRQSKEHTNGNLLMAIGLSSIVVIIYLFADHVPYPLMHNGLLTLPFGLLILGLAQSSGMRDGAGGNVISKALSSRPMVKLGQASFAIYILHSPILNYLSSLSRLVDMDPNTFSVPHVLVISAIIIGISIFAFEKFEEPSRKALRNFY